MVYRVNWSDIDIDSFLLQKVDFLFAFEDVDVVLGQVHVLQGLIHVHKI